MNRSLLLALALSACAHTSPGSSATPRTLVLVHGAFADHHAFDAVVPLLTARGFKVLAPDLPGHGDDATPAARITLDTYVAAIRQLVQAEGEVTLVGHSMAGMVVSQVAELEPRRVRAVVYVAAYLPRDGQALQQLAEQDPDSLVGKNLQFAADYSTVSIKREAVAEAIAADLPAEVQRFVVDGQRPEPLAPFQGKVALTAANFGAVPRAYLRTTADRAVTPALQQRMLAASPGLPERALPTGHLPFVARPAEFVDALVGLVDAAR